VAHVVETLRLKTGRPGFDFPWSPRKYSSDLIFQSVFSSHGVHSVSNRNEYQGISLGVKCGRHVQLTTLPSEYQSEDGSPSMSP
jgi:hypothetical protein